MIAALLITNVGITSYILYKILWGDICDSDSKNIESVTINRIVVESNDPERFVYGMKEAFAEAVKNPTAVRTKRKK